MPSDSSESSEHSSVQDIRGESFRGFPIREFCALFGSIQFLRLELAVYLCDLELRVVILLYFVLDLLEFLLDCYKLKCHIPSFGGIH